MPEGSQRDETAPAAPSFYARENRELHDKLEAVLNSGDTGIINAVVPNIEIFYERLRPKRPTKTGAGGAR